MNDVRPRWVHYREDKLCKLAELMADGRVLALRGEPRAPHLWAALLDSRYRPVDPAHSADPRDGTWHDLDECAPVPPEPPQAMDFAAAFAAMRAGRTVRKGSPGGDAWRIAEGRFHMCFPSGRFLPSELYAGEVAGPWYLDDGEGEA